MSEDLGLQKRDIFLRRFPVLLIVAALPLVVVTGCGGSESENPADAPVASDDQLSALGVPNSPDSAETAMMDKEEEPGAPVIESDERSLSNVGAPRFSRFDVELADGTSLFVRLRDEKGDRARSYHHNDEFEVDGLSVSIHLDSCTSLGFGPIDRDKRGPRYVLHTSNVVAACPDLPLTLLIESETAWQEDELGLLELRLLSVGSDLAQIAQNRSYSLRVCCSALGPIEASKRVIYSEGYEGGNITAIDPQTGDVEWETLIGERSFLLAATDESILAAPLKGSVIAIEPSTGMEQWRVEVGPHASVTSATAFGDGGWLFAYDFSNEGDTTPSHVARVDAHGSLIWTAKGHEGTEWLWHRPLLSEGRVFMRDYPYPWGDVDGTTVHAFSTETGKLLWRRELHPTLGRNINGLFALPQDSEAFLVASIPESGEIVRLATSTGRVEWSVKLPPSRIVAVTGDRIELFDLQSHDIFFIESSTGERLG